MSTIGPPPPEPGRAPTPAQTAPFPFASAATPAEESMVSTILKTLHESPTALTSAFFSQTNRQYLQDALRGAVATRTGYAIDRQSDEALAVHMRAIYVDHAARGTSSVDAEVRRLNDLVLRVIVPMAVSGVTAVLCYQRDAGRLSVPLPRAQSTTIKGENQLQSWRGL